MTLSCTISFFSMCLFGCGNCVCAQSTIKHSILMGNGFAVRSVAFSPNGKILAVACGPDGFAGEVRLFSMENGKLLARLNGHKKRVNSLVFFANGKLLVSAGSDGMCLLWNTTTHRLMGTLQGHSGAIIALALRSDGKQLASASRDKTIVIWDLGKRKRIATIQLNEVMCALAYSRDGERLVAGGGKNFNVWDVQSKKLIKKISAHEKSISCLAFDVTGQKLITCGYDGYVKLWKTKEWAWDAEWYQGRDIPICLGFSRDGNHVAVGCWSGEVVFYNQSPAALGLKLGQKLVQTRVSYRAHDLPVTAVAFRHDDRLFASGSLDTTVKTWINLPK